MAKVTAKPKLSPERAAWVSAYVAAHGPIKIDSIAGYPATMAADGSVTIAERSETVTATLLASPPSGLAADVVAAAPGWIDGWIARGVG